ncbi:IgGFc-binding protein-like [Spea bombifrons]|uniref:IgGFc-binding protein-like n=1 Tax=Spea bombifrons TaxID=233779 RepID=UPI00234A45F6|nr:IgGFc-binding protein-like [Spea bombifrons]
MLLAIISLLGLCANPTCQGATGTSPLFAGKDFVTVFMDISSLGMPDTRFDLLLHGLECCTLVNVTVKGTFFSQTYTIQQGETTNVTLPASIMLAGSSVFTAGTVLVTSDKDICVSSQVWANGGFDWSYVYPVELLGMQYYTITATSVLPGSAQFAVVSGNTSTSVTVTLKAGPVVFRGSTLTAGSSVTVNLAPYGSAQFQLDGDLSGSIILASQPVAVLGGHQLSQQYLQYSFGYVYEQLMPTSSWGRAFLVPPLSLPQRKDDKVAVVAGEVTRVRVYNVSLLIAEQSLGRTDVMQIPVNVSALRIDADHDVMAVYLCAGSSLAANSSLRPYVSILLPTTMFRTAQVALVPFGQHSQLLVAATSGQTSDVTVDGIQVSYTWDDNSFRDWKFSWIEVSVGEGSHYIQHSAGKYVWVTSYSFSGNASGASSLAGNASFSLSNTGCDCEPPSKVPTPTGSSTNTGSTSTNTNGPGSTPKVSIAPGSTPKVSIAPSSTPTTSITPGSSPSSSAESVTWSSIVTSYSYSSSGRTMAACEGDMADLFLVRTPLGWWDALRYCRHHYTDLFSVPDGKAQQLVTSAARSLNVQGLWIGLRRHRVWGHLYWTDGEPVNYVNWGEREPSDPLSKLCTAMSSQNNFTWDDVCCDTELSFICY